MPDYIQYLLVASVAVVTGFVAQRLSASVRGDLKSQALKRYFLDGTSVVPGLALALLFLERNGPSDDLLTFLRMYGSFILPYSLARFASYRWAGLHQVRRQDTLPLTYWFDLLKSDQDAAHRFLVAYLAQATTSGRDLVPALDAARRALERSHRADPVLATALARLDLEVSRLEAVRERVPGPVR